MQAESWTCHNSQLYVPFYPCSTTMCLSEAVGRQPVCREVQCPRNVSSYPLPMQDDTLVFREGARLL